MEWLASPSRFRPAFQLLQNVTYKMVARRKSPTESESEADEESGGGAALESCSTLQTVTKDSTDSTGSNVEDSHQHGESMFDEARSSHVARQLTRTKHSNDVSDSRSNDSVFDDYVDSGASASASASSRREPVLHGSTSSAGSTDSTTKRSHSQAAAASAYRKQNSLTIQLPSVEMLKRSHTTAPARSPRSLRVDQFDKTLYSSVDEATMEARAEQPTVGRICAHVAYDVDTRTVKLALISTTLSPQTPDGAGAHQAPSLLSSTAAQLAAASTPSSASASPVNLRQRVCVQVTLMPDRITKQSALQRSARCIHWKEELLFTMDAGAGAQLTTVCDKWVQIVFTEFDKSTQPFAVAECRLDLSKLDLLRGEDVSTALTKCSRLVASCGEMLISLNHLPNAGRLNVDVQQARGLFKRAKGRNLDTYVKVILSDTQGRCSKNKKTSIIRNCNEPHFNETFVFDTNMSRADPEGFFDTHMVSVYLYASSVALTERDEVIGRLLFGPSKYASGEAEKDCWSQLRTTKHAKDWYKLRQPARFGSDSDKHEKLVKAIKSTKMPLTGTVSLLS